MMLYYDCLLSCNWLLRNLLWMKSCPASGVTESCNWPTESQMWKQVFIQLIISKFNFYKFDNKIYFFYKMKQFVYFVTNIFTMYM